MLIKFFKKYHLFVLVFAVVLFLNGCTTKSDEDAQTEFEIDKEYPRGPLTVHLRVSKTSVTIAETFIVEFEAAIKAGYEVKMPKIDEALQTFGLIDWRDLGDKLDEENNVVKRYNYRFEPILSGEFEIPSFVFEFQKTAEDQSEEKEIFKLETEPVEIEVTSLLGEDRANLVIADIENVVELPRKAPMWPIVVLGIIAVALGVVLLVRLKKRKAIGILRIFRPAHEVAYERLSALVAAKLIEAGQLKEFYEQISNILRHYIEDRFDLRAPERTTEEFLFELKYAKDFLGEDKKMLEEFLRHCDLVKFAKHHPTTEQIQKTFNLVKEFIEKTKSDQRQIDVTEMNTQKEAQTA